MIDIARLSGRYSVRPLSDSDADDLLDFCLETAQYYQYCGRRPTRELILSDLHIAPPGVDARFKHYVGFHEGVVRVAIMDLIEGYPDVDHCFIGFFMMNRQLQGRQVGSAIIREACGYLKEAGFAGVFLGIDKGNPQSTHFWKKNGFRVVREVERDGGTILVAEKAL